MKHFFLLLLIMLAGSSAGAQSRYHVKKMATESLDRGVVAIRQADGKVVVSWRVLRDDHHHEAFDVYRNGHRLTPQPLTKGGTFFIDEQPLQGEDAIYEVKGGSVNGQYTLCADAPVGYLPVKLEKPEGGKVPVMEGAQPRANRQGRGRGRRQWVDTGEYTYSANDASVGDVDGDGQYEIILKWEPSNSHDNSHYGYSGPTLLDCYRLSGERLWRINLGTNIRSGAHYTQFMVYDFDGDGRAELMVKTADGTIDGQGTVIGDSAADYRSKEGRILSGPEYISVFDGLTGRVLDTKPYIPERGELKGWGDDRGNRSERYLGCVAYLGNTSADGSNRPLPSLVMCRGYYTSAFLWAVDFDGASLNTRWLHCSTAAGYGAFGEGAHSQSVADVDGDGFDEIIYGSCTIDHDGTLLYRTGLGHGDALHVGDFMPDRNGLEVMMVHEETSATYGVEMRDALTGEHLSGVYAGSDVGRGLCADIDASSRGAEYWSSHSNDVYSADGVSLSTKRPTVNFRTYWDGDLQDELTEKGTITKWTGRNSSIQTLVNMVSKYKAGVDLIKYTPCLQADIFGDWREEQIYYDYATCSHLWIFSTPYPTDYSLPTLMHDHQYRMATVWQTSAYNQPPHLSFHLPDYAQSLADEAAAISTLGIYTADVPAARIVLQGNQLHIQRGGRRYMLSGQMLGK